MGLFGISFDNEKFVEIEREYSKIYHWNDSSEALITAVDHFIELCNSLTPAEKTQFNKYAQKHSKVRDRSIGEFEHPLYGFFFKTDSVIDRIIQSAIYKKKIAEKEVATIKEYENIVDVAPTINSEGILERNKVSDMPEIKIQNITKSFDADAKLPSFIVLDLETTGLRASTDRIIQVCALRYEQLKPTEAFISYVNPGKHISEEASEVNGIHDEDVKDAPALDTIADSLIDFIGKSPIVGFNVSFDLGFLFCSGIDLIAKRKIYDAKALAKKLYKSDIDYYSLDNVLKYNGISIGGLHDAKADCFATGLVFKQMLDEITA